MDHPEGWIIPASPALAHRPNLLSLPLNYAALLIMTCLFLGLTLQYPAPRSTCSRSAGRWASW